MKDTDNRPERFEGLTNEELSKLIELRSNSIVMSLKTHAWRDCSQTVYPVEFAGQIDRLYEVLLAVQNRYEKDCISSWKQYLLPVRKQGGGK